MKQPAESRVQDIEIKVVGKSGQISLGKRYAGKTLRLERREDGTVLLTAVAMVPENQLWTTEEPHRSRIERGLAWAAANRPDRDRCRQSLEEPNETDVARPWPPPLAVFVWT